MSSSSSSVPLRPTVGGTLAASRSADKAQQRMRVAQQMHSDAVRVGSGPPQPAAARQMLENTAPSVDPPPDAAGVDFHDFAAAMLADAGSVAARLAAPQLGQAWSRAMVMYWSRLHRQDGIDLSQPLYVLDLAPGEGQLAACVLPPLAAQLRSHGMHDWPVRYLACSTQLDQHEPLLRALAADAALQPHAQAGLLHAAQWPARTGQPLLIGSARLPLFGARNPVVVLVAGGWSTRPARLHAVHRGALLRGRVRAEPATPGGGELQLSYEWAAPPPADEPSTAEAVLLARYCAGVPSAALLLSEQALAQIDAVADFSAGRYLLLCADAGVTSERQIRSNALAPPAHMAPGQLLMPVNFHALGWHQRMNGAQVAERQCQEGGWVLHLACRDDLAGIDEPAWAHLAEGVLQAHPDDRALAAASPPEAGNATEVDWRLRASCADPWALDALLAALDPATLEHDPLSAQALQRSLMLAWAQAGASKRDAPMGTALARLLCALGAWGAARTVLGQTAADAAIERAAVSRLRAAIERRTGRASEALQWAQHALQQQPGDAGAAAQLAALRERLAQWQTQRWYAHEHMRDGELGLELLDATHCAAMRHQLRDPQIAEMAQLPPPAGNGESGAKMEDDAVDYALMHAEFGFVGVVGFRHQADAAFFHLWIGADFQGHGLGGRAVRLLLGVLRATGIALLFTAVYRDNQRCRRILERAGFAEVPGSTIDDADFAVVHRATADDAAALPAAQLRRRLRVLCRQLDQSSPADLPPDSTTDRSEP